MLVREGGCGIAGASGRRVGMTLIELLIVIGIIVVLAGIGFTFTAPAREKARQAVCINNLRQIGLAVQMYRTEWGGTDTARTPAQWGFPSRGPDGLRPYLGGSDDVLHCPSADPNEVDRITHGDPSLRWCLYNWCVWDEPLSPACPPWDEALARRGPDFPLVTCIQHDRPRADRPAATWFILVLRVAGSVEGKHVPRLSNGWDW